MMLDSAIRVNKKHYSQTILGQCKHEIKRTKMRNLINGDLEPSLSDNETDSDSDNDIDNTSANETDTE